MLVLNIFDSAFAGFVVIVACVVDSVIVLSSIVSVVVGGGVTVACVVNSVVVIASIIRVVVFGRVVGPGDGVFFGDIDAAGVASAVLGSVVVPTSIVDSVVKVTFIF